ncbi:MAG: hypothetical protein ABL982_22860, partial [Vicinamibacterales bacterium]
MPFTITSILGPSLTSPGNGTLNVRGNILFDTVNNVTFTLPGSLNIRCGGNWTASTQFAPTSSTVTFDGGVSQDLSPTVPGNNLSFFTFAINAGTAVRVLTTGAIAFGGIATNNGGLDVAVGPAVINANAQMNLNAAASTNLGTGLVHVFGGSLNVQSTHALSSGAGTAIRLAGTGTLSTSVAIPCNVEITGSYALGAATLQQNLTYSNPAADLVIGGSATVTINGNASFTGRRVTCPAAGSTLNVRGNVLFDTTNAVTFTSPGTLAIRCGGNWTANASFAPTTSLVTFDGSPPQVASPVVPGATLNWFDLTIATNSNLQLASTGTANVARVLTVSASSSLNSTTLSVLQVGSTATLNGVTSLTAAQLSVTGQCNMNAGGATTLGPGKVHTFGNNLTVTHAFSPGAGSLARLQGTGSVSTAGAGSLQDVQVTGTYSMAGSTILGNLDYPNTALGVLLIQNNTVLVNGNATLDGPSLNGASAVAGILNVRGNLTIDTINPSILNLPINIQVGGTWTAGASFVPQSSSVTFNGTAPQVAQSNAPGGTLSFFDLIVPTGSSLQIGTASTLAVGRLLTVQASASLSSTSVTLTTVGLTCTVGGTMNLSATELRVTGQCNLQSGGSTTLGAGKVHLFGNNLNVGHLFNAGAASIARLQGTGVANSGGSGGLLPTLEVTGSYQFGNPSVVQGDFVQTPTGSVVIQNTV